MTNYEPLGWAIGVVGTTAAIFFAAAYGSSFDKKAEIAQRELERARVESGYVLHERDLNGNGIPERFFERKGEKYFLAIDGKNLEDTLRR